MLYEADETGNVRPSQDHVTDRSTRAGLRLPGLLGQHPLVGVLLVILGLGVFGLFAYNVQTNGPLVRPDVGVANSLHVVALGSPAWLRDLMIAGYYLGQEVIVVIGLLLALYFIYRRFWPELAAVVIAWAGEGALWLLLAPYFGRSRPAFPVPVWHELAAPSFPSGHTMSAVMCYGLLAYLVVPHVRSWLGKAAVVLLALLVIVLIGFSRVFIGDHYLTDVLAGLFLGIAWACLVYTAVELVARSRTGPGHHENSTGPVV